MKAPTTRRTYRRTPKRRPKKRPNYWARRLLVLLVILIPVATWYGWGFINSLTLKPTAPAPRVAAGKPVFVAVMGVDERTNDTGRSDTLMLLRLDPKADTASVINVPRDTLATVNGQPSKINAAYSEGGPGLTTQTLSDLLGIPQPYYVTLNFQAFEALVNLVGGVDIDVDKHYVYDDPYQDLHIDIPAGRQHLMGDKALQYVRVRYDGVTNSDIARIERQKKFLNALKDQVPANWTRIPAMIQTVKQYMKTNVPESDQLMLAKALFDARNSLTMQTLPGDPDDSTGDWLLNRAKWNEVVQAWTNR